MNEPAFFGTVMAGRSLFFALLAMAAYADWKHRRIPNSISAAMLLSGLFWHLVMVPGAGLFDLQSSGSLGIGASALAAGVALPVFFVLYCLRVFGAGDVKLLAGLAAWVGLPQLMPLMLLVMICGGLMSLPVLVDRQRRQRVVANLNLIGLRLIASSDAISPAFDAKSDTAFRLPYACAILSGSALYAAARYYEWWSWL